MHLYLEWIAGLPGQPLGVPITLPMFGLEGIFPGRRLKMHKDLALQVWRFHQNECRLYLTEDAGVPLKLEIMEDGTVAIAEPPPIPTSRGKGKPSPQQ